MGRIEKQGIVGHHCVQYESAQITKFITLGDKSVMTMASRTGIKYINHTWPDDLFKVVAEEPKCDKCIHKLACLIDPECCRTFESK